MYCLYISGFVENKTLEDYKEENLGKFFVFLFYFYAPEIEDRGAYFFCPVCHSVLLSETLTLLITFEQ